MGEVDTILSMIRNSVDASDSACLKIINTPSNLTERESYIENAISDSSSTSSNRHRRYYLQPVESWRIARSCGIVLDNTTHQVRANCFKMDVTSLPPKIYHYHVSIYRYDRTGNIFPDDLAKEGKEVPMNIGMMKHAISKNPEWKHVDGNPDNPLIGLAYDGRSSMYATHKLPLILAGTSRKPELDVSFQAEINYPPTSSTTYLLLIGSVSEITVPRTQEDWKKKNKSSDELSALQALDIGLSSFAKWECSDTTSSKWLLAGNKVFAREGTSYDFSAAYMGRLGYYFSLKATMAGLVLMTDVSVNCFLRGGKFIELMAAIGGFRNVDDMYSTVVREGGLNQSVVISIEKALKSCKLRLIHVGHTKVFKKFGPSSDNNASSFEDDNGNKVTVDAYFKQKAAESEVYRKWLPSGKLKYPALPTISCGSANKPILIPVELAEVIGGQSRNQNIPGDVSSQIIKYAAMLPNDRFRHIDSESNEMVYYMN
jgi:hypothetical protein